MTRSKKLVTLYRPVGSAEYKLIKDSGFTEFPPRLPEQPIFYPVLTEEYAIKIARDWNVKASGIGYVLKFGVDSQFLKHYDVQQAGGSSHQEYWIPAEELPAFNKAIIGKIEVTRKYERWFVYIVQCNDGTLYTGITNNLEERIKEHNEGKGAKYTRGRGPVTLVKCFERLTKSDALKLEYHIKQLSKEMKLSYAQEIEKE